MQWYEVQDSALRCSPILFEKARERRELAVKTFAEQVRLSDGSEPTELEITAFKHWLNDRDGTFGFSCAGCRGSPAFPQGFPPEWREEVQQLVEAQFCELFSAVVFRPVNQKKIAYVPIFEVLEADVQTQLLADQPNEVSELKTEDGKTVTHLKAAAPLWDRVRQWDPHEYPCIIQIIAYYGMVALRNLLIHAMACQLYKLNNRFRFPASHKDTLESTLAQVIASEVQSQPLQAHPDRVADNADYLKAVNASEAEASTTLK